MSASELHRVLAENRSEAQVPDGLRPNEVMKAFLSAGLLRREQVQPLSRPKSNDGTEYRIFERLTRKEATPIHVALSLRPESYISHASAAQHHGLLPVDAGRLYVNKEQSPKPESSGTLSQEAIDRAFSNAPRISNYVYGFKKTEIVLLNGKNTANHGVANLNGKLGSDIPVTSLDRTLVDIAVRPAYSGGIEQVLSAFQAAAGRVSVPNIVTALKSLRYIYPYHQAIGFYLERAGLSPSATAPLKKLRIDFNFYLANQMPEPILDPSWRVFYPKALDRGKRSVKKQAEDRHRQPR